MSTLLQTNMWQKQVNIRLPYTSLQNCWIFYLQLVPVKGTTIQGQKCFRKLVAAKSQLARTIVSQGGFRCTPSIMAMYIILEEKNTYHSPSCGSLLDAVNSA